MTNSPKAILVDPKSFDLDNQFPDGDLQDAYLVRFLCEAISDGYEVLIVVDNNQSSELRSAIENACACCFDLLGDYADLAALEDSIIINKEIPRTLKKDLIKEDNFDSLDEIANPLGEFELVISPASYADFSAVIDCYASYRRPCDLTTLNAFEEYKESVDDDLDFREHIAKTAEDTATCQLTMIEDASVFHRLFGEDYTQVLSDIGRNKTIYGFCNSQPLNIETPSTKNPAISTGEFYLTHYFANLLRTQNPNVSISEESALEAENTQLVIAISEMNGGDAAIHAIHDYMHQHAIPRLK